MLMQDSNFREIPKMVSLAQELGVENLTFSYLQGTGSDELNTFGVAFLRELFIEAKTVAANAGTQVFLPPLTKQKVEKCFCMERVVLSSAGEVYPCPPLEPGYSADCRALSFGNVVRQELMEIWESENYRKFRQQVLNGEFPASCSSCGFKTYHVP